MGELAHQPKQVLIAPGRFRETKEPWSRRTFRADRGGTTALLGFCGTAHLLTTWIA